jgi:sugar fermentation stimulation protein A
MNEVLNFENIIEGKVVQRKNRFVIEVLINNKKFLASNNNTGRLLEYFQKNKKCLCLLHLQKQKTKFRLIAVENCQGFALIDTNLQMKAFENALERNLISFLKGAKMIKRNPRYKDSVFDYLVKKNNKNYFLELKSAVLRKNNLAMYPDCPTERGRRHIKSMTELKNKGMIIFICALPNVQFFTPCDEGDPEIRKLLKLAKKNEVKIKALKFTLMKNKVYFEKEIKVLI